MATLFPRRSKNPNESYEQLRIAAAQARLPYDKDLWLNLAFYLNEQYVEWNADTNSVRTIPREEGFENTPRPVSNKIMHFVASEHAEVLQNRPNPDVLPASDDPIDASNASVCRAYCNWLADPQVTDFDGVLSEAVLWALLGEGYLKWTWNPKEKRGDISAPSPLDIYGDPFATNFNKSRYVIHSQFMDVEQIYDLYGTEVPRTSQQQADPIRTQLLREMGASPILTGALVNELWLKPCRRYPKGLFVTWSGQHTLLEPGDFPYDHKHIPFTQIGSIPRPKTPHSMSAVKYLRSPQMELNQFHAQRILVRRGFSNPKWFIDTQLELDVEPDDSPNQILRGDSKGGQLVPIILQPQTMPNADAEGVWIAEEMADTVGLHEVSQAQVPGRVESSKAIELLRESDKSRMAELTRSIKSAISEGFWQELMLAKQYMTDEALVETYSREGLAEVKRFRKDMVKPGIRVRITMGTGLANSRAARAEQVGMLWDRQIITDPETVAELLDIPSGTISPNRSFDIRLARSENLRIAEDEAMLPNSWDDHELHIREHNNFRKTGEYEALDSEVKQKFEHHVTRHKEMQVQVLNEQAMKMQLLRGAGVAPEEPEQSGPPPQPAPPAQTAG